MMQPAGYKLNGKALSLFILIALVFMFLNIAAFPAKKSPFLKEKESAAVDPNALRAQANNDIQVAFQLVTQADSMLKGAPNREMLKAAVDIYVRAGQTAERATNTYKSLQPKYATDDDVRNSQGLMERCMASINEIKKVL
jgi:uncharacterized alpha-E superfamily protein